MADDLDILLLGAGGHGAELVSYLADLARVGQPIRLLGALDDGQPAGPWLNTEILGPVDQLAKWVRPGSARRLGYLTAVGSNLVRQQLVARVEAFAGNAVFPWTLVHPTAQIGRHVEIGPGTCLAPGSMVTTRVLIGPHCILNVKASVSHDCVVGAFCNINPGVTICGKVRIGTGCYIGAGATLIDGVSIGEGTVVGAGAVVVRDLPPRVTAVGVPARIIKYHACPAPSAEQLPHA
jgi:sugar O-acyltransferase (sialic acid O-acetyltransferase NeuD family)